MAADCIALASVPHVYSLFGPLAPAGIAAFAAFLGLGHSALKAQKEEIPFNGLLFGAHLLCVGAVVLCNVVALHGSNPFLSRPAHLTLSALVVTAMALLALACVPLSVWIKILRAKPSLWISALLAGVAAGFLRHPFQSIWNSPGFPGGHILQIAAFHAVRTILRILLPDVIADPANFTLGTPRFLVFVAPECSGLEGLGLVLVFTSVWLWYYRKESRFPQALLLIPCALAGVWLLNIVRLAAIVLIGNAGAADVAMIGFHSQVGWIAFTAVALMFSVATQKLSWMRRIPAHATGTTSEGTTVEPAIAEESGESPATPAYLVPFLAILAASFISKAASGSFEWLYPLRFIAGACAIWFFRNEYRKLDWRFGWLGPSTGLAIFFLWLAPTLWTHESPASASGAALALLSPAIRTVWIAVRVAAAITTVPIAEELAFRGYLSRRLISRNFDTVPFSSLSVVSIGVSSIAFGLMHGNHWIVGIIAGVAYALVLKWRGRIGDAIIAHATTNLLLAAWVLLHGDWAQW